MRWMKPEPIIQSEVSQKEKHQYRLTHWKRLWCWEGLGAGGEGDDRGWDGWMASLTRTWVWVNSGSWWWTGRPGVQRFTGFQRVGHDWATELYWTVRIYMEFRKMVTITLYARQQKRHRCIEQSFGLCGRGRGGNDLGEWHWNMYNII